MRILELSKLEAQRGRVCLKPPASSGLGLGPGWSGSRGWPHCGHRLAVPCSGSHSEIAPLALRGTGAEGSLLPTPSPYTHTNQWQLQGGKLSPPKPGPVLGSVSHGQVLAGDVEEELASPVSGSCTNPTAPSSICST